MAIVIPFPGVAAASSLDESTDCESAHLGAANVDSANIEFRAKRVDAALEHVLLAAGILAELGGSDQRVAWLLEDCAQQLVQADPGEALQYEALRQDSTAARSTT